MFVDFGLCDISFRNLRHFCLMRSDCGNTSRREVASLKCDYSFTYFLHAVATFQFVSLMDWQGFMSTLTVAFLYTLTLCNSIYIGYIHHGITFSTEGFWGVFLGVGLTLFRTFDISLLCSTPSNFKFILLPSVTIEFILSNRILMTHIFDERECSNIKIKCWFVWAG